MTMATLISKFKNKLFSKNENFKRVTYSQQGEDLMIDFFLKSKNISEPFYVDIGANHPIQLSNTYLMYKSGGKGICIEPNLEYQSLFAKYRKKDNFLPIGINGGKDSKIPYYKMAWPEFNTFDKDQAEKVQKKYKGKNNIIEVIDIDILNINNFLEKYCNKDIDVLNLDVEGLDLEILSEWDFNNFKPKLICVETKDLKTGKEDHEITNIIESNGYVCEAKNQINSIFTLK